MIFFEEMAAAAAPGRLFLWLVLLIRNGDDELGFLFFFLPFSDYGQSIPPGHHADQQRAVRDRSGSVSLLG